jgi:hypothetical protein
VGWECRGEVLSGRWLEDHRLLRKWGWDTVHLDHGIGDDGVDWCEDDGLVTVWDVFILSLFTSGGIHDDFSAHIDFVEDMGGLQASL